MDKICVALDDMVRLNSPEHLIATVKDGLSLRKELSGKAYVPLSLVYDIDGLDTALQTLEFARVPDPRVVLRTSRLLACDYAERAAIIYRRIAADDTSIE